MIQEGQQPDEDFYVRKLRRLAKHPFKVLNEQIGKMREEGKGMGLPSDEERQAALRESEEAFCKALAMPNKTIVEVLIQGAELVNAIGAKAA
jgi:hypothetical protein